MIDALLPILLAAAAGACIVVQQALNANLRAAIASAAWSGFASYAMGLAFMAVLAAVLRDPAPPAAVAARVPWWAWTGGLFGATYIALAILLVPKLGSAAFIALLIAGQMVTSILFDHFGWLGIAQRPLDPARAAGVLLLVAGVALIRR